MSLFVKLAISCMLEQVVFSSLCVYVGVSDQFAISGACETDNEERQTLKEQEKQAPCFIVLLFYCFTVLLFYCFIVCVCYLVQVACSPL